MSRSLVLFEQETPRIHVPIYNVHTIHEILHNPLCFRKLTLDVERTPVFSEVPVLEI